jgi:hypothetical protein
MRLQLVINILSAMSRLFRLIGIDIVFAVFYTKQVEKLEDYINDHINQ